jgi:hypothetical protein
MSYSPGTLFRIYAADNSKHYTAVLLKDGQVLEVKNPDTGKRETFPGLSMWRASHSATEDEVKVDFSKGVGVVIGSNTNGFNYPTEKHSAYNWVKWCYSIVTEAVPQLLDSEEFKTAYNNMVDLLTKHKKELSDYHTYGSGVNCYSPYNIRYEVNNNPYGSKWCGFNGHFKNDYYHHSYHHSYYSGGKSTTGYSKDDYDKARTEIVSAYKTILDIIKPKIEDHMNKKFKIAKTEKDIRDKQAAIKRTEKKLIALQSTVDWYKSYIEKETANLAKMNMEFVTSKTASL